MAFVLLFVLMCLLSGTQGSICDPMTQKVGPFTVSVTQNTMTQTRYIQKDDFWQVASGCLMETCRLVESLNQVCQTTVYNSGIVSQVITSQTSPSIQLQFVTTMISTPGTFEACLECYTADVPTKIKMTSKPIDLEYLHQCASKITFPAAFPDYVDLRRLRNAGVVKILPGPLASTSDPTNCPIISQTLYLGTAPVTATSGPVYLSSSGTTYDIMIDTYKPSFTDVYSIQFLVASVVTIDRYLNVSLCDPWYPPTNLQSLYQFTVVASGPQWSIWLPKATMDLAISTADPNCLWSIELVDLSTNYAYAGTWVKQDSTNANQYLVDTSVIASKKFKFEFDYTLIRFSNVLTVEVLCDLIKTPIPPQNDILSTVAASQTIEILASTYATTSLATGTCGLNNWSVIDSASKTYTGSFVTIDNAGKISIDRSIVQKENFRIKYKQNGLNFMTNIFQIWIKCPAFTNSAAGIKSQQFNMFANGANPNYQTVFTGSTYHNTISSDSQCNLASFTRTLVIKSGSLTASLFSIDSATGDLKFNIGYPSTQWEEGNFDLVLLYSQSTETITMGEFKVTFDCPDIVPGTFLTTQVHTIQNTLAAQPEMIISSWATTTSTSASCQFSNWRLVKADGVTIITDPKLTINSSNGLTSAKTDTPYQIRFRVLVTYRTGAYTSPDIVDLTVLCPVPTIATLTPNSVVYDPAITTPVLLIAGGWHTTLSTNTFCNSFTGHVLVDSNGAVPLKLSVSASGQVDINVDVRATYSFNVIFNYGGQVFSSNLLTVDVACPSLTIFQSPQTFSLTIPNIVSSRQTIVTGSSYLASSLLTGCSVTYALFDLQSQSAYPGTWVQVDSSGDISVDINTPGSASVYVKMLYSGTTTYQVGVYTVSVDCPALTSDEVLPAGTVYTFNYTTLQATQVTLSSSNLIQTTSTSSQCSFTLSLINSDTGQKADGVEGDFLYFNNQGEALVNTNILGTKNLWGRAVYQSQNYDTQIFQVSVVCPTFELEAINPSTFSWTQPELDGQNTKVLNGSTYLSTYSTCAKTFSVIDSSSGSQAQSWVSIDSQGNLIANLNETGNMKVKIRINYDGMTYDSNELTVSVLDPAQTQLVQAELESQVNQSPIFYGFFPQDLIMDVIMDSQGIYDDPTNYIYTSPKASDPEGNSVSIILEFIAHPAVILVENSDQTFNIIVERSQVTASFEMELTVILRDQLGSEGNYNLKLKVNFQKEDPPPLAQTIIYNYVALAQTATQQQQETILEEIKKLEEVILEASTSTNPEASAAESQEAELAKEQEIQKIENDIKMASEGFVKTAGGYQFPGIDVNKVNEILEKRGNNVEVVVKKGPPKMKFGPVSSSAIMTITFTHKMIVPKKFEQAMFDSIFKTWIVAGMDGSQSEGSFNEDEKREERRLEVKQEEAQTEIKDQKYAEVLKYTPQVTKFEENELQIKFNFYNYKRVSTLSKDKLVLQILQPELFQSAETLEKMSYETLEIPGGITQQYLPPIIDQETTQNIKQTTRRGGQAVNAITQSNFFLTLIIGGSMQQLWGMIRAMQIIVYMGLVTYPAPGHTIYFMKSCMLFASMDVMDGQLVYNEIFKFKDTEALNDNFNQFGIGDKNFIMNSGSYFIFFIGIILFKLVKIFSQVLAVKCSKRERFRKLGIKTYSHSYWNEFKYEVVKLFLESYLDLVLCAFLNFLAFWKDGNGIHEHMQTFDDSLCTYITIVYLVLLVIAPFYGLYKIWRSKDNLKNLEDNPNMEVYIDGIKLRNVSSAMYNIFFMFRRFATIYVVVYWEQAFFQIEVLSLLSFANLCYLARYKPLQTSNSVEVFNECCIYAIGVSMVLLLNINWTVDVRDYLGWGLIAFGGGNILYNLTLTVKLQCSKLIEDRRLKLIKASSYKELNQKIFNRKMVLEEFPDEFEYFENELKLMEAIKYCKKWQKQRKWLIKRRISYYDYPEEIKFQELVLQFQLKEKGYAQTLIKVLNNLALNKTFQKFSGIKKGIIKAPQPQFSVRVMPHHLNQIISQDIFNNEEDLVLKSEENHDLKKLRKAPKESILVSKSRLLPMIQIEEEKSGDISWNIQEWEMASQCDFKSKMDTILPSQRFQSQMKTTQVELTNEKIIDSVFDDEITNIYNSSLTRDLSEVKKVIPEMDGEKRAQTLMKLEQMLQKIEDPEKAEKFKTILIQEKESYEGTIKDHDHLVRKKKVFENPLNSQFLNDQSDSSLEEEVQNVFQQEIPNLLQMHQNNQGIKPMLGGGVNDYVQAVLQCLLVIESFVKFFLGQEYQDPECEQDYQMCDLLRGVFIDTFQDGIKLLEPVQETINVSDFLQYVCNEFGIQKKGEVDTLMGIILQKVNSEVRGKNQSIPDSRDIIYMFQSIIHQNFKCIKDHEHSRFGQTLWKIDLDPRISLEEAFRNFFQTQKVNYRCRECSSDVMMKSDPIKFGKILILNFEIFDKSGMNIGQKRYVPLNLDLTNMVTDKSKKQVYSLFAVINAQGPTKDLTFYEVTTLRKDPELEGGMFWVQFLGGKKFAIPRSEVVDEQNPKMLFYKLDE